MDHVKVLQALNKAYVHLIEAELIEYRSAPTAPEKVYHRLPESPEPPVTFPAIVGRSYDENFISDHLAYILDPARNGIGSEPLRALLDLIGFDHHSLESLKFHPESFGASFEAQSKLPKLMFEKALEQPSDDRFLIRAFAQQALVGICGFVPGNSYRLSKAGTIIQMYVQSEYRGRKIGLGLSKATINEAFKISGIDRIVLEVKHGNIAAIRVYRETGFQPYNPGESEIELNQDSLIMIIDRND